MVSIAKLTEREIPDGIKVDGLFSTSEKNKSSEYKNTDQQILKGFTLDDLDQNSLKRFRTLLNERYPDRNFQDLSDENFLIRTGAAKRDRHTGSFELFAGTVLFIGKTNVIVELFPHFHLDYFEFKDNSAKRWDYRISDNDYLRHEINLLTFFESVSARLKAVFVEPFTMNQDFQRLPDGGITWAALREALVNSLVHADYQMNDSSVRIEYRPDSFRFSNPGQMLIDQETFFQGGTSKPRNELLMKLFGLTGFSERQGFGGSQILQSIQSRDYKMPELHSDLDRTTLTIWTRSRFDLNGNFTADEKTIINIFLSEPKNTRFSFSALRTRSGLSEYRQRKALKNLVQNETLITAGKGRGLEYQLS